MKWCPQQKPHKFPAAAAYKKQKLIVHIFSGYTCPSQIPEPLPQHGYTTIKVGGVELLRGSV